MPLFCKLKMISREQLMKRKTCIRKELHVLQLLLLTCPAVSPPTSPSVPTIWRRLRGSCGPRPGAGRHQLAELGEDCRNCPVKGRGRVILAQVSPHPETAPGGKRATCAAEGMECLLSQLTGAQEPPRDVSDLRPHGVIFRGTGPGHQ